MIEPLRTATSLAVSLRKAGDQAEAMKLAQDTYSRYTRRYGSQSPEARICALNLACDYAAGRRLPAGARPGARRQGRPGGRPRRRPPEHARGREQPRLLPARRRPVRRGARARQGRQRADAADAGRRAPDDPVGGDQPVPTAWPTRGTSPRRSRCSAAPLAVLTQVLGPDHPDTLICQADLADHAARRGQGRRGGATGGGRARAPRAGARQGPPGHQPVAGLGSGSTATWSRRLY